MPRLLVHFIFKSASVFERKCNFRIRPHSTRFSLLLFPSRGKGRKQKNGHFKIDYCDTMHAQCGLKSGFMSSMGCSCAIWLIRTWQNLFIQLIFASLNEALFDLFFLPFSASPLWRINRQRTRGLEWHYLQYKYYIYLGIRLIRIS
jgi:hypothetical protein